MKHILVVAPFVSLPGEPYFNRFLYLCYLWAQDYEVTLVTSSFCHPTKQQRLRGSKDLADLPFKLILIDEPGYKTNVSFARFWSHRVFHKAFKAWLINELTSSSSFDIIFSAFPLISTNLTLGELKSRFNYKLVIDVQDIWPDSIFAAIPFLKQADFLLSPLRAKAHQAYGYADAIVAVSQTYLEVACSRRTQKSAHVTYLGSDYQLIESINPKPLDAHKVRLVYIGTLSHSYDLETVIRGFLALGADRENRFSHVELHILGDGPKRERLQAIAGQRTDDSIFFHGYLPYTEMVAFVKACHFTINPIVGSAAQSITNKLSDYIAFGLPILSSQRNWEAMELIKSRGGYLFEAGSPESFEAVAARAILLGAATKSRQRDATDLLFDRRIAYPKITEFVKSLCCA